MSKNRRNSGFFIWDDAQCFIGSDGVVATSYTNSHVTITFAQNPDGTLTGFTYETENTSGEVSVIDPKQDNNDD